MEIDTKGVFSSSNDKCPRYVSESIVIPDDTKIRELVKRLDSSIQYDIPSPEGSIMGYGQLCQCDDMCLCEHRLQWLIGWIKENYKCK